MYYYDASSDKVNLDILNNIKTLLKNENFYFVYCEGGNNPERFDWTYNTFQLYSETDKVELYKKESEWQPLLESSSSENVIEIANSVHNLNPNAKEGSIASVVTGGKTLIDVKKAPLCRIELGEYIFSEDLVKVDDIDINIIKQTLSYEDCPDGIELYDFNSQYCLIFRVENEGIKYMHFKEYSEDMPAIFYYDSDTDTVNSTVIDDIREILKNGDYRITHYSSVSYGYSQELIDWLFNTFQLYSGTDSKVELYKKEGSWKPLQSNVVNNVVNDFVNANTPIKETLTGAEFALLNGEVTDDVDKQNQNLNITHISKGCVKYNDQLFNFDNNVLTGFVDNQIKQYEINSETGEITEKLSIDIETLAGLDARIKALESN